MNPDRLRRIAQDRHDAIDAIVERWTAAWRDNHAPARRRSRAGRVSGSPDPDITYSDPVGQTAALTLDLLDQIGNTMQTKRQEDYDLARLLEEWAPARQWDNIRRCGEEGCARKHYGLGLCELHYRREKRIEERRKAAG